MCRLSIVSGGGLCGELVQAELVVVLVEFLRLGTDLEEREHQRGDEPLLDDELALVHYGRREQVERGGAPGVIDRGRWAG